MGRSVVTEVILDIRSMNDCSLPIILSITNMSDKSMDFWESRGYI